MRLRHSAAAALAMLALTATVATANTGFSTNMTGSQEVPPTASTATGTGTFVLNGAGTQLTMSIQFQNLQSDYRASHIHGYAPAGANASVRFGFTPTLSNLNRNGVFNGVWNLNATDVTNLIAGLLYVNIHSNVLTGGEIRGQIYQDNAVSSKTTTWGRVKQLYRR